MQQDILACPGCGAPIDAASSPATPVRCAYCDWVPSARPATQSPSPENRFRRLLKESSAQPDDLLEQVPEEMRGILAGRLRAAAAGATAEFSEDSRRSLRAMGYAVAEDSHGARISPMPRSGSPPSALSASDVVRMAAELDGGIQTRTQHPACSKCQGVSPVGQTKCQWCGEPLPSEQAS